MFTDSSKFFPLLGTLCLVRTAAPVVPSELETAVTAEIESTTSFTTTTDDASEREKSNVCCDHIYEGYGQIQLTMLKQMARVKIKAIEDVLPRFDQIRTDMKFLLLPNCTFSVSSYEDEVDNAGKILVDILFELTKLQVLSDRFASLYRTTTQQRETILDGLLRLNATNTIDPTNDNVSLSRLKPNRISFSTPIITTTTAATIPKPITTQEPTGEEITASIPGNGWTLEITNLAKVPMENFQSLLEQVSWYRKAPSTIDPGTSATFAFNGHDVSSVALGVYRMGNQYAIFRFTYPVYYTFGFGILSSESVHSLTLLKEDSRLYSSDQFTLGQGSFSFTSYNLRADVIYRDHDYKYLVKIVVSEV